MKYWVEHFKQGEYAKFALKQEVYGTMSPIEANSSEEAIQKAQLLFPDEIIKKRTIPRK